MEEFMEANLRHWDGLVPIHERSAFYDVDGFRAGASTLKSIELEGLGDVSGKSMLHLQCHFGLDTLSWARHGASVTGVDYSKRAIDLARSLGRSVGIDARFIVSDVYDLPSVLDERYDIVFTSYGVLMWLPELGPWADVVSHFLKPGGTFYIVEFHPFAYVFYDGPDATGLTVHYPYFHAAEPLMLEPDGTGSYADRSVPIATATYEWSHGIGDIVSSLISAGLTIEYLHEYPYSMYELLPNMTLDENGWWRLKEKESSVPLMFSIKAKKRS